MHHFSFYGFLTNTINVISSEIRKKIVNLCRVKKKWNKTSGTQSENLILILNVSNYRL